MNAKVNAISGDLAARYASNVAAAADENLEELERVGNWILQSQVLKIAGEKVNDMAAEMLRGAGRFENVFQSSAELEELVVVLGKIKESLVYFGGVINGQGVVKK